MFGTSAGITKRWHTDRVQEPKWGQAVSLLGGFRCPAILADQGIIGIVFADPEPLVVAIVVFSSQRPIFLVDPGAPDFAALAQANLLEFQRRVIGIVLQDGKLLIGDLPNFVGQQVIGLPELNRGSVHDCAPRAA